MFGYVRPLRGELKVAEYETYRAAYCGLCRTLGKEYGFAARFFVSYDLTFLYCLLSADQKSQQSAPCRCPANPLKRRNCLCGGAWLDWTALANVLLMYRKLHDTAADEKGTRRLGARLGLLLYRRAYRRAAAKDPELDRQMAEALAQLAALEAGNCASLDRTADAFARLLAACAAPEPDETRRRILEELLYHVGRFIYLTDALDDLPEDLARGGYNPVALRYGVGDGGLPDGDEEALAATIELSISRAAAALELLEPRWSGGILRNIIYLGLPSVLQSVRNGTFENQSIHLGASHERSI